MKSSQTIRYLLASLLLLTFSFSMLPRTLLHELTASHADKIFLLNKGQSGIQQQGFQCDQYHWVVDLPFTQVASATFSDPLFRHFELSEHFASQTIAHIPAALFLRGPPRDL